MLCDRCPAAYHPLCLGYSKHDIQAAESSQWSCPHHLCGECGRKVTRMLVFLMASFLLSYSTIIHTRTHRNIYTHRQTTSHEYVMLRRRERERSFVSSTILHLYSLPSLSTAILQILFCFAALYLRTNYSNYVLSSGAGGGWSDLQVRGVSLVLLRGPLAHGGGAHRPLRALRRVGHATPRPGKRASLKSVLRIEDMGKIMRMKGNLIHILCFC